MRWALIELASAIRAIAAATLAFICVIVTMVAFHDLQMWWPIPAVFALVFGFAAVVEDDDA